jgi:hypothetical protein
LGTNRAKVEVKAVFRGSMALYNSEVKNIRSMQITRFNREIVNVGDDSEELALYKK